MNILTIFLLAVASVSASSDQELWKTFKANYGKTYKNYLEEQHRYKIFQDNLRTIEEHNKKFENGEETYKMGVTQFTDLTSSEFGNLFTSHNVEPDRDSGDRFYARPDIQLPDNFDWRQKEPAAVSDLRNEYYCGAYYAMSAVSALEGQVYLKHNKTVRLSEQEIIDCSLSYQNLGCVGGTNHDAFDYIVDHGVAYAKDYPFKRYIGDCKNATIARADVKVTGYVTAEYGNETAVQQALVAHGPLSTLYYNLLSQNYVSGIYDYKYCPKNMYNMAGLIVGYGVENNTPYWTVQAYYGPQWGEKGYFRIIRNQQKCGIANHAIYPVIE